MKRLITWLLIQVLCLSLCACGGTNIEKFCDGYSIMWDGYEGQNNDSEKYYALFSDGTLTIEKRTSKESASSPTGKLWSVVGTEKYSYELKGSDTVIIDGETYTYEISNNRVKFNKDLVGIETWWKR